VGHFAVITFRGLKNQEKICHFAGDVEMEKKASQSQQGIKASNLAPGASYC